MGICCWDDATVTSMSSPAALPPAVDEASLEPDATGRWPDLQEAALKLFSERGYHGTTMKQLAGLLGVQAPSLYNHVGSKQEILQRLMMTGMGRLLADQDCALLSSSQASEQLRAMTEAHVLVHTRRQRSATVVRREIGNLEEPAQAEVRAQRDAYERRFRGVIQRGVEEGSFTVDSVKLASFAIIEMASGVAVWFSPDGPLSAEVVAREFGEMALRLVGANVPGREGAT
jgi:AcrR family transcriptional regulator